MLFTTVLKDNKAYQRCYRKGRFAADGTVCAYFYPNGTPYNRLGISVSKKLGNAVVRNRVKRIVRAAYRLNEEKFPIGYDIVFVGRNNIGEKKSDDIESFIGKRLIKEMNKPFKAKAPKGKSIKSKEK
jgi:ribonuclease P protein component